MKPVVQADQDATNAGKKTQSDGPPEHLSEVAAQIDCRGGGNDQHRIDQQDPHRLDADVDDQGEQNNEEVIQETDLNATGAGQAGVETREYELIVAQAEDYRRQNAKQREPNQ